MNKNKFIVLMLTIALVFSTNVFAFGEVETSVDENVKVEKVEEVEVKSEVKEEVKEEKVKEEKVEEAPKSEQNDEVKEDTQLTEDGKEKVSEDEPELVETQTVTVTLMIRNQSGWVAAGGSSKVVISKGESGSKTFKVNSVPTVTIGKTTYTFKGYWTDDNGVEYSGAQPKIDRVTIFNRYAEAGKETVNVYVYAQYDESTEATVTVNYIDNVANGGHSWSNTVNASFDGYSNTLKAPTDIPANYEFLYWDYDGEHYSAGDTFSIAKEDVNGDVTYNLVATYKYQPSVKVIYHYLNGTKDTGAKNTSIDIYANAPIDAYWFYDGESTPIAKGEAAEVPEAIVTTTKQNIVKEVNVYAKYFTVTWVNDGNTLELDENVPYGDMPEYNGETPSRESTAQYTYIFAGWTPEISEVTSDVTYTATYNSILNKYTVRWVDEDGTELEVDPSVPYGMIPVYNSETPTKEVTAQYTYTFAGWTPEVVEVTGDATYTATYTATVNTYTVIFDPGKHGDFNTVTYIMNYGSKTPNAPKAVAKDGYKFVGWAPEIADIVTDDVTYVAQWKKIIIPAIVTEEDEDDDNPSTPSTVITSTPEIPETNDVKKSGSTTIEPADVPKNIVDVDETGTWALINLICIIIGAILSIFALVMNKDTDDEATEDEEDADDEERRKIAITKVVNTIIAVIAVVVFFLTENMSLPMVLTDKYTILMVVMALINGVDTGIIANKSNKDNSEDEE